MKSYFERRQQLKANAAALAKEFVQRRDVQRLGLDEKANAKEFKAGYEAGYKGEIYKGSELKRSGWLYGRAARLMDTQGMQADVAFSEAWTDAEYDCGLYS